MKVIKLAEIDSTNEFCKRFIGEGDMIVTASEQTDGRGTKGRSFVSDEGGLYISVMRTYKEFDYSNTFRIMINACVAVCKTVESFRLKPVIKWANDVLIGGKKVCGTLIENRLGADGVCTSIVGIGLNINNVLPEELNGIATTMSSERGKKLPLWLVRARLIKYLKRQYTLQDYKKYINWFGSEVSIDCGGVCTQVTAVDVDDHGNLVCKENGKEFSVSSAEISLRLK